MKLRPVEFVPAKLGGGFKFPVEDYMLPARDCYMNNPLIKRGHTKQGLNKEQLMEIVKCSHDPIYFATNYLRIVSVDDGIIPFKMWEFQRDMMSQYKDNRFSLTVTARQMGKTTTVAAFILWFIIFHPNKECAILANKGAQAQEVMDRLRMMFEYLPFFLQPGVTEYNKQSLVFDNGSKAFSAATSSSSIRGHSVALLYIDEAAFIENDVDFYTSTYPVITSGQKSRVIMTSTPKGKRGMFYKLYFDANQVPPSNNYKTLTVTWRHHPKRDEAWRDETIRNTSPSQFAQEFDCAFHGSSGTLIPSDILETLIFLNPVKEDEDFKVYAEPIKGHRYVAIADPAMGVGQDSSVCTVIDVTEIPYKIAAKYRNNWVSPLLFPHTIVSLANQYFGCPVLVEANNDVGGQVSYILYYELEYENTVMTQPDAKGMGSRAGGSRRTTPGIKTTPKVKGIGCANLKTLLENHMLEVNDYDTIEELGTFIQKGKSYEADEDCHDDCVMALVLFSWFVKQDFFKDYSESDVSKSLYESNKEQMMEQLLPFGFVVRAAEETAFVNGERMVVTEGSASGMASWFMS